VCSAILIDQWRTTERLICIIRRGYFGVKNRKLTGYMYWPVCVCVCGARAFGRLFVCLCRASVPGIVHTLMHILIQRCKPATSLVRPAAKSILK
jgi:hypothetical protein